MKTKTKLSIICLLALLIVSAGIKTKAQIVYTDITDTTIFIPNSNSMYSFYFDLNNDNSNDYIFTASKSSYTDSYGHLITGQSLGIGQTIYNAPSKIAGGCIGSDTYIIYASDTIHSKLFWGNNRYVIFNLSTLSWECTTVPIEDFFFGLKLVVSIDTLYGWVRCTATDSSITVKDYAYNSNLNSYILAGQTIGGVDIDSLNALINIFAANGTLTVDFNGYQPAQGNIIILNIAGQLIKSSLIIGAHNLITLNAMSSGIYIVRIETPEIVINKKIFFQEN